MKKIRFACCFILGEFELSFTPEGEKTYVYRTYDGYKADRIRNLATLRPGAAWALAKSIIGEPSCVE
jgi:uncharacterized protein YtpQ (UPF0354 family)